MKIQSQYLLCIEGITEPADLIHATHLPFGILLLMASTLGNSHINKSSLYIYTQIRLNGHTTRRATVRLVPKLAQSCYLGQTSDGCVRPRPNRSQRRIKVWGATAITGSSLGAGNTSRKRQYYSEAQNVNPALANPAARHIGLVAGAGVAFAVAFALFRLVGKVIGFGGPNKGSARKEKLQLQSNAQLNDSVCELPISRSSDMSDGKFNEERVFSSTESLAYTKTAEEVDVSMNGVTDTDLKLRAGIPSTNDSFETPNLKGDPITDKGAKGGTLDLNLPRRSLLVLFTCDVCGVRTERIVNRQAYERGTIFVQCAGCEAYHKLVDNLGLIVEYDFSDDQESSSEQL